MEVLTTSEIVERITESVQNNPAEFERALQLTERFNVSMEEYDAIRAEIARRFGINE